MREVVWDRKGSPFRERGVGKVRENVQLESVSFCSKREGGGMNETGKKREQ